MPQSKVIILGGDGMAGSMVAKYLQHEGYYVESTTRRRKSVGNKRHYFDVSNNLEELDLIIEKVRPEFVVNCIGILNQAAEDNHPLAVRLNALLPQYVDAISKKHNFKFVHISTDCVFSGEKGKYKESDTPDAKTFYGRSKALGEIREGANLTFRTSIVGPDPNLKGIGLFNWFMRQSGAIGGYKKAIWSGVTTLQLAKSIEESFDRNTTGLYHLVNNDSIDKYSLLTLFKKHMKKDIEITPTEEYVNDKSLVNSEKNPEYQIPSYDSMIKEMSDWIMNHKEMYANLIKGNE